MKLRKLLSILCAIAIVASAMTVMAFAASDDFGGENLYYGVKVPEGQTITVDGVLDDAWANTQVIPVNLKLWGDTTQPSEATVRVMWDEGFLYVFGEVTDSTHFGYDGGWTEWNDCFEIFIDLLHDDGYSKEGWTGNWGGDYRGDVMCEAHYKINGGISDERPGERFGNGNEACWDFWWANASKEDADQESQSISKLTDTGYTVEYKIKATFNEIPESIRPHADQVIGLGVKVYDSHNEAGTDNTVMVMEGLNDAMGEGPKKLSDMKLVNELPVNPPADETPGTVTPPTGESEMIIVAGIAVLASVVGMVAIVSKRRFTI